MDGVAAEEVLEELGKECSEAGMVAERASRSIIDCSAILEERSAGAARGDPDDAVDSMVVRHKLRFTLLERADEVAVSADAWTETEELGIAVEESIASEEYLDRVQDVLVDVGRRLRAAEATAPPWAERYASEQAWHLDAHLRSVSYCDANLASVKRESLEQQLEAIGMRPLSADARDRCEQLYQRLFEWGLARGDAEPTVEEYASYRAALPPEQRACSGRLALASACR
jgi:hypothetical protein